MTSKQGTGRSASPSTPWPELLPGERGENWTVKDSPASHRTEMTNIHDKRMFVPTINDEELMIDGQVMCPECTEQVNHNSSIRWHELLHAAHSPTGRIRDSFTVNGVKYTPSNKYIQMAEECRMDRLAVYGWRSRAVVDTDLDGYDYSPTCEAQLLDAVAANIKASKFDDAVEMMFGYTQTRRDQTGWYRRYRDWLRMTAIDILTTEARMLGKVPTDVQIHDLVTDETGSYTSNWIRAFKKHHQEQKKAGKTKLPFKIWFRPFLTKLRFMQLLYGTTGWTTIADQPWPVKYKHEPYRLKTMSWSSVLKAATILESRFEAFRNLNYETGKQLEELMEALDIEDLTDEEREALDNELKTKAADRSKKRAMRFARGEGEGSFKQMIKMADTGVRATSHDDDPRGSRAMLPEASRGDGLLEESEKMPGLLTSKKDEVNERTGVRGPYFAPAVYDGGGEEIVWAPMWMEKAPMTKGYPVWKLQKQHAAATEQGDIPRSVHRMTVDQRIFKRKRAVYGASVLIDDSGSMSYTLEELEAILDIAPASVVALYAGNHISGMLRIVAENGKRVEHRDDINVRTMGGNDVDYPALVWLAHQPWPRVWITDGEVVSPSHGYTTISRKPCEEICHEAGIVEVTNARMAEMYIKGKLKAPRPKARKYKRTMVPRKGRMKI